jgi:hypothetical protein
MVFGLHEGRKRLIGVVAASTHSSRTACTMKSVRYVYLNELTGYVTKYTHKYVNWVRLFSFQSSFGFASNIKSFFTVLTEM